MADDPRQHTLELFQQAEALNQLAETENPAENRRKAIALYEELLTILPPSPPAAMVHYNIAQAQMKLYHADRSVEDLQQAVGAFQAAVDLYRTEEDRQPLLYAMMGLAASHQQLAHFEEQRSHLTTSREVHLRTIALADAEPYASIYFSEYMNLGNVYHYLSEIEDREANLQKSLEAYEMALRYYSPQNYPGGYAYVRLNQGTVLKDAGDQEAAREAWQDAQQMFRALGNAEQAEQVQTLLATLDG
jgi:tetratricopeptide (TPR) repeat protein